ncbi:MAG: inorganic phosphate transporter [Vallitaleaceae bacterium]|jgi:PiT family inorganic phosphate transporter|nr:inorganic phosphate transporter [Vallitaleaceae bacterium]
MGYFSLLASAFVGWGLGANDSANIFGIAVYTKVVKYSTAVILTVIFVMLGAYIDGHKGIEKLSGYAFDGGIVTNEAAFFVMLAAGLTVMLMTILKIPVSTSQAVIGSIMGGGILGGHTDLSAGSKFFGAWVLTPIGSMVIAYILYFILSKILKHQNSHFKWYEITIKLGYIIVGILGAYALGANNVANVTAIFAGNLALISTKTAVLIGGAAISLGVITYSKSVMSTIGKKLVPLSAIAGLMVVLASAIIVYIYARVGIPVSTSQAVVGGIIGVGFKMGVNNINKRTLRSIVLAWVLTPTIACLISLSLSLFL